MKEFESSAEEIVKSAYKNYGDEKAIEMLVRMYSPHCDGKDETRWSEIKNVLAEKGVSPLNIDRASIQMREYNVVIRKFDCTFEAESEEEIKVLALCYRHAYERAAEQFATENEGLDPKQWYVSHEKTVCNY
jgi:hypothetical protein